MHTLPEPDNLRHAKRCAPPGGTAVNNRTIHGPRYRTLAKLVRDAANRNPDTRCWSCGKTIADHPRRNGKPQHWTAGHLRDGQPDHTLTLTDLRAEASGCNYSRGASYGNRQRTEPCSPEWQ